MTDRELLNQIKQSAEQIDIPDSISPDRISSILKAKKAPSAQFHFSPLKAVSAAAVFLFMGILSAITWNSAYTPQITSSEERGVPAGAKDAPKTNTDSLQSASQDAPKQNAGSLYTVAKSYDDFYDALNAYAASYADDCYADSDYDTGAAREYGAATGNAETFDTADGAIESTFENRAEKQLEKLSGQKTHSSTNLQTEGVDESDLIKTDGSRIYTVSNRQVFITDVSNGSLKQIGVIEPDLNAADSILELYADKDTLLLLAQRTDTDLETTSERYYIDGAESSTESSGFLPLENTAKKSASVHTSDSTILYVYDISDPASPVLQGTTTQEGFYYSSRKIGDIVYLFTQKGFASPVEYQNEAKANGGVIPCVNGKEIAYDHIYLPEEGNNGLICSSVNMNEPQKTIDDIMILYDYAEIYVSADSIYLYRGNYRNNGSLTEIAKFHIEEGMINAVNATSVKGTINDVFAIQEHQDNLRILTTSYNNDSNTSNQLYLLDKNLNLVGSLEGIAEGEEIYAARYFENTAYFITYRNTDPLFAADISDPANPRLLGELEISGFSEYLHFWGNDKLLGIGYETNADSGEFLGLKLVMFDISDPVSLTAIDSLTESQYTHSPALYNYKSILADSEQNLIGFTAQENSSDADYVIYAWEDNHFTQKQIKRLSNEIAPDSVRGIYIGDKFYIASPKEITAFDMANDFQEISHITLQS